MEVKVCLKCDAVMHIDAPMCPYCFGKVFLVPTEQNNVTIPDDNGTVEDEEEYYEELSDTGGEIV